MVDEKLTRDDCLTLLREKHASLRAQGEERYPKRSDFAEREAAAIKAFLGPWPRALEAAGIKEPRADDRSQKNREKRIRAKKRRIAARKEEKNRKASPDTDPDPNRKV